MPPAAAAVGAHSQCNDACGFAAALLGSLCYGTYGVPLKLTANVVDTHPLVLQSYKTTVCFLLSWTVLLFGPTLQWTSYGIIAGLLWVCGGTFGCVAVLYAGIAVAVGTWAGVIVLVNFVVGILIFHEPVQSLGGTVGAFSFLSLGLIGMTKFASPPSSTQLPSPPSPKSVDDGLMELVVVEQKEKSEEQVSLVQRKRGEEEGNASDAAPHSSSPTLIAAQGEGVLSDVDRESPKVMDDDDDEIVLGKSLGGPVVHICGQTVTRRQAGVVCAVLNGLLSGSSLVPLHYAKRDGFTDMSYFVSFSSGAIIANSMLWIFYFLFQCAAKEGNAFKAWEQMPSLHFAKLWKKMILAGILLSGGQFGAILATSSLGQAVGNSLIQSKILVSGVWGLCVFREMKDRAAVTKWFLSALLSLASILWLTYERRPIREEVILKP